LVRLRSSRKNGVVSAVTQTSVSSGEQCPSPSSLPGPRHLRATHVSILILVPVSVPWSSQAPQARATPLVAVGRLVPCSCSRTGNRPSKRAAATPRRKALWRRWKGHRTEVARHSVEVQWRMRSTMHGSHGGWFGGEIRGQHGNGSSSIGTHAFHWALPKEGNEAGGTP
jgi:hypothetical protein